MDNASRLRGRRRAVFFASIAGLSLLVGGVFAAESPAASGVSCSEAVLADWVDDGRIDVTYDRSCYLDAIDDLPEDIRTYSSAEDDISRALQSRRASVATTVEEGATSRAADAPVSTATPEASGLRSVPAPIVLLSGVALAVGVGGLGASVARRVRKRP